MWGQPVRRPYPHEKNISLIKTKVNELRIEENRMELSQAQKDLIHGLKLFGCEEMMSLVILARLWHPDDIIEMLLYMVNNRTATPEELYNVSSRISAKRGDPPEIDEEE